MTATDGELGIPERLAELTAVVKETREIVRVEAVKRDERIRLSNIAIKEAHAAASRSNRTARWAGAIAVIAVAVAVVGVSNGIVANRDRKQRTATACRQSNVALQRVADKDKANFDAFIDLIVSASSRPIDPAIIARAKAAQHDSIQREADTPFERGGFKRDCSPAGLRRFYSGTTTTTAGRSHG